MTSAIDICNNALAAVGTRTTIASLDESSNEALQCKLQYESTRDAVLRAAHWGFARRFASGGLLKTVAASNVWTSDQPPPPWKYQYAYPSDCVAMRYVVGQESNDFIVPLFSATSLVTPIGSTPAKWARVIDVNGDSQTQTICTNAPQAIFCYTMRVTDINNFDPMAQQAFIMGLASQIAIALTGDKTLAKELAANANNTLMTARVADANEGVTVVDPIPDWLAIRGVPNMSATTFAAEYGPLFEVK